MKVVSNRQGALHSFQCRAGDWAADDLPLGAANGRRRDVESKTSASGKRVAALAYSADEQRQSVEPCRSSRCALR